MSWSQFFCSQSQDEAPCARECHSICTLNDKLVLFGGNDASSRFNDVYVLDTASMMWQKQVASVEADAPAPPRRSAHTAAMIDQRFLYVIGGWDGSIEVGDVTRFDLGVPAFVLTSM
jgi:N-acetylneuraminic acid mutarotase